MSATRRDPGLPADRGYFNATVEHAENLILRTPRHETPVIYTVTPANPRAWSIQYHIPDFDDQQVRSTLQLQPGALSSPRGFGRGRNSNSSAVLALGYLSPTLQDPKVERNPETNQIDISLNGNLGPKVDVEFKNYTPTEKKQKELLPLKREGNLDYSVIEEGARRMRNQLQEDGYFFAEINTCLHGHFRPPRPLWITARTKPAATYS